MPRLSGWLVCGLHSRLSLPHPFSLPALSRKPSSTKSSRRRSLFSSYALFKQASCTTRRLPSGDRLTSLGLDSLISETEIIISALQSRCCVNEMQKCFLWYEILYSPEGDRTQLFAQSPLCITLQGPGPVCLSSSLLRPSLGLVLLFYSQSGTAQLPHTLRSLPPPASSRQRHPSIHLEPTCCSRENQV